MTSRLSHSKLESSYTYLKMNIIIIIIVQVFVTKATPVESDEIVASLESQESIECFESCQCVDDVDRHVKAICGGDLTTMPRFTPSDTLTLLDLSFNKLSIIPSDSLENIPYLEVINFNDNEIREFDFFSTKQLRMLRRLSLERNVLSHLDPNSFNNNPSLTFLSLSGNPLQGLFTLDEPFLISMSLTSLDLSNSQLISIPSRSFTELEYLKQLDLSGNRLESLPLDLFQSLQHLEKVYLAGNPWKCGPELDVLKTGLQEKNVLVDKSSLFCINEDGEEQGWFEVTKLKLSTIAFSKISRKYSSVEDYTSTSLLPLDPKSISRNIRSNLFKENGQNNNIEILSYTLLFTNVSIICIIALICLGLVAFVIKKKCSTSSKVEPYYSYIKCSSLVPLYNHSHQNDSMSSVSYCEIP